MNRFDPLIRRLFAATVLGWAVLIVCGPLLARSGAGIAAAVAWPLYVVGSLVCHQRPERSFAFAGAFMPVCARCTGIYFGAAAAVALAVLPASASAPRRLRDVPGWTIALASAVPSFATLVYEWTTGDRPANWLRAVSGVPMGAVVAWLVLRRSKVE